MEIIKNNKIIVRKEDASKKVFKGVSLDSLAEENIEVLLHAGDSYAIPGNTPHSFEVMESGEVVDVFTPPREDYL